MATIRQKRLILVFICFLAIFVTSWLELFVQRKQHLIGAGINRAFLFLLINAYVLVIALLLYFIVRHSIRLFLDYYKARPGSVFKRNLLFALTLFSVIPSFFVFFTAGKFIATSIDDWFHARIGCGLQNGLELHRQQTQDVRVKLTEVGQKFCKLVGSNPDTLMSKLEDLKRQNSDWADYAFYVWGDANPNILGSIKDEVKIWRTYRKINDRSTHSLKKEFWNIIRTSDFSNPFDFYGSLYFVKFAEGLIYTVVCRYPEKIRYPLIEVQNSISDYQQLKSMRNPIYLNYIFTFILVTLLILFLSIWCAFYFARGLAQPIQELLNVMAKIRGGDLDARIKDHPGNDLRHLTMGINDMANSLQQAQRKLDDQNQMMLKMNTLKTWQEAAKQMAHEIKNPLTPIQLATQRMQRKYGQILENDPAFVECTNIILSQVKIIQGLVSHFSKFATMPQLRLEPTCIDDLIRDAAALYQISYPDVTIELIFEPQGCMLNLDKNKMKRVFTNLLDNSVRAIQKMDNESDKIIKIQSSISEDGNALEIMFSDTGLGISKPMMSKLFLPYVSTEKKNMGLGLAIVSEIILHHGGTIHVEPSDIGAKFKIVLPLNLNS